MDTLTLIQNHDKWRKNIGGAPAGVAGLADANAYAGLDLNLITFMATTFTGSSFSACTFHQAQWSECQFVNCTFAACDFDTLAITGCTFTDCTFEQARFSQADFARTQFLQCRWDDMNFDQGHWREVDVHDCTGTRVVAKHLRGEDVDFRGSYFEDLAFEDTLLNGAMSM